MGETLFVGRPLFQFLNRRSGTVICLPSCGTEERAPLTGARKDKYTGVKSSVCTERDLKNIFIGVRDKLGALSTYLTYLRSLFRTGGGPTKPCQPEDGWI